MGLGDKDSKGDRGTFSEDVLRLEICGPEQEHFSVVDVPGIFRKTTEGMTTKADKEMVKAMVRRYMDNPRSIMLTVIPANVDIATQEILTMAEEADGDGHRTLGVLTKPDLVDSGAEAPVMDLIKGEKHKLSLGWCIVRNLGQKQLQSSSADRNAVEMEFFRDKAPWNALDGDRVGIAALRIRLQEILASNIRREFPKVRNLRHATLLPYLITYHIGQIRNSEKACRLQASPRETWCKKRNTSRAEPLSFRYEYAVSRDCSFGSKRELCWKQLV